MKKRTLTLFFGTFVVVSTVLLTRCGSETETTETGETAEDYGAGTTNPDQLCLVKPSWFPHDQTPAPQEGKGSPFDASETTNQIFHQWSWQKFLWLTKPDKNNAPLFLNQEKVKQVSSHMELVTVPAGSTVALQDSVQAGSSQPQLTTNPDYNGGSNSMVFYSIHMNKLMYTSSLDFAAQLASGKLPASNEAMFPVGSFELKVAWVPVSAIPASKRGLYYTTTATITRTNAKPYTAEVALIGMHVVGVVENHPEFIWATFEHADLAPNYDWKNNVATSSTDKLLFKKGKVSGIDGIRFNTATKLGYVPYQVFDLFQYGVPRNSDGSFMTTCQQEPQNYENVAGINKCVKENLKDVWNNYFYNGSIWLNMDGKTPQQQAELINSLKGQIGSAKPGSYARGSLNCANVTMESFTQTFQSDIKKIAVDNLANCFSCHQGLSFSRTNSSPLYLSHTFQGFLLRKQGSTPANVEKIKTKFEDKTRQQLD